MKLTKSKIDTFRYEGDGKSRDVRWDDAVSGFGVRIYPTGRKAFVLSYRNEARKKRQLTLGDYGPLTLDKARETATQRKADVIEGKDPVQERRAQRKASLGPKATYRQVVDEFVLKYAQPRQRTWKETERVLLSCTSWLNRPIAEIGKTDTYSLIEGFQANGQESKARVTLTWLRALFRWAVKRDYLEANVMDKVDIEFQKTVRERHFSDDEVKAIWNACNSLGPLEGAYLKLLMLLSVRKGELAGMRRTEFNDDGKIWIVPHERTKTRKTQKKKREYIVPLPPLAQRILKTVPKIEGEDLVFPGRIKGRTLNPGTSLKDRLIKASGVDGFTYHALRHTVATWFENEGHSVFERSLVLNHSSAGVTSDYSHGFSTELKCELLEKWADHVAGLVQPDGVVLLS